ncbi:MAG: hybrid sensor histidine kinase/response regulator [Pseudomonadota bacterium]
MNRSANSKNASMQNEITQFANDARRAEYEAAVVPFLVWLAGSVIVICIFKDIARVGFQLPWVLIRLGYLPVACLGCFLPRWWPPLKRVLPEFALWVSGAYIIWFCSLFSLSTGNFKSDYVFGIYQFFLGIALIPISRQTFFGFSALSSAYYFWEISRHSPHPDSNLAPAVTNYVSFYLFSALIYVIMSRIRKRNIELQWELRTNIKNQSELIGEQSREIAQASVYKAVAATTQMLAHDVRKPFSILKMGLGMLGSAQDPAKVKNVLAILIPEIDRATRSVDGMIADVMEIGSTSSQLIKEPVNPESLIEATLGEVFRVYPKSDVKIIYDLRHRHMVNVHMQKVGRVFSNIFGNALQAMNYKGNVWFKSREVDGFIEFCLGNEGSLISEENIPELFQAFFTSGKQGGTGLGLAIAEKVVKAHGGKIWCESLRSTEFPNGKVEFFFTLPIAVGKLKDTKFQLPTDSREISHGFLALNEKQEASSLTSVDQGELTLEDEIAGASSRLGRPLNIMIVDDEEIYRSALSAALSRTPELVAAMTVYQADSSNAALDLLSKVVFDLIITDVDMGGNSLNGFDLVHRLRHEFQVPAMICVHSNRIVSADHKTAIVSGADAFLPKPMARGQLLRLTLQAGLRPRATDDVKPEVLFIDDNSFFQEAWESVLKPDSIVHLLSSPEELAAKLSKEPQFLDKMAFVITDFYFDNSRASGLDVGRLVKKHRPDKVVLLCSDGEFDNSVFEGAIDRTVSKVPVTYRELIQAANGLM